MEPKLTCYETHNKLCEGHILRYPAWQAASQIQQQEL